VAKFRCTCGTTISTSGGIPNAQQWLLISDQDFGRFSGAVQAESVYTAMTHAYRCESCDRLWVFWPGYDTDPTEYVPARP
jgi:hypothetical protein